MNTTLSPKARGELTEAIVLAKLIEYGYAVSLPFGDNSRYDMVVDDGRTLDRVQIKTARDGGQGGTVEFNTVSVHPISGKATRYTGQIEAFIAYHPGLQTFYRVPVGEATNSPFSLRTSPPLNNQRKGIRWARDYLLQPVLPAT